MSEFDYNDNNRNEFGSSDPGSDDREYTGSDAYDGDGAATDYNTAGNTGYGENVQNTAPGAADGSASDGTYHYAGDPYQQQGGSAGKDGRNPRYRYHGQQNEAGSQFSYGGGQDNTYDQTYDGGQNGGDAYDGGSRQYYSNIPDEPKKKRSDLGVKIAKIAGAALLFGVVAGVGFAGVSIARDRLIPAQTDRVETTTVQDSGASDDAATTDVSNVVNAVMPSVVSITSKTQVSNYFFGTQESEGAGSGFILAKTDDTLMIATNNHVIEGATDLTVGFSDGSSADATIIGTDSDADLAVIAVKASDLSEDTLSTIKIAVLGSSDDLQVGETVVAIGNALGYGQSVTTGVVSAKDREVSFTDGTMTLLQTDAAINPGNSGGVLVNMKGEVVGINNAKLEDTSVEGMGYAIPISTAQDILTSLMNADSIPEGETAYLGIVGRTIDSQYSQALGMPSGAYVSQVVKGSPAEEAGIEAGDIITGFEGRDVSTMDGLKQRISLKKAGEKVEVTLQRANQNGEYQEQTVTVTLGKQSDYEDAETATEEFADTTEQGSQRGTDPYEYYYNNGGGNYDNGGDYYSNPFDYFFN